MTTKDSNKSTTPQDEASRTALGMVALMGLLATPVLAVSLIDASTTNVFTSSFDSLNGWAKELCCNHSAEIVSSPLRMGDNAVRFTLYKVDWDVANSKRAELKQKPVAANSEYTYEFSMYLPDDYVTDSSMEIITQWHDRPDLKSGDAWKTPPLYLKTDKGQFVLQRRWDSRRIVRNNKPQGKESINLGPYQKGVWTDWKFHIKWSYKSDGLVEVWKNGKLVVRKTGPNTYNDAMGPYFKIGIYKPDWKRSQKSNTTQRVIYFDQVRIDRQS